MATFNPRERKATEVLGLLAQHLTRDDRGRKVWAPGWSARRVAKACGVSPVFVAEVHQWRMKPAVIVARPSGVAREAPAG